MAQSGIYIYVFTGQEALFMRWERRKPLWPTVAALGLLFVLALAAPRLWQDMGAMPPGVGDIVTPEPPQSIVQSAAIEAATKVCSPPVATPPREQLPARHEFDLDTLFQVRDLLLAVVDQLPPLEMPKPAPTSVVSSSATEIRVSSEHDRLAMLPRRERFTPPAKSPAEVTDDEVASFAEVLLEASQRREPANRRESTRSILAPGPVRPKLAVLPEVATLPRFVETPVPTEPPDESPEPTAQPIVELPRVDASPIEVPIHVPPPLAHRPVALIEQLENFSVESPGAVWSQQVLARLRMLVDEDIAERPDTAEILAELEKLYRVGVVESEDPEHGVFHSHWRQAAQGLGRRLVLWRVLLDPDQPKVIRAAPSNSLMPVLAEVATLLETADNGADWREYLLLDRIAGATSEGMNSAPLKRTKLAQEVLARMADERLTAAQSEFLTTDSLVRLHDALRPWAAGEVNLETLAALLERYESNREMRFAAAIAQLQQRLHWSSDPRLQSLASHLNEYYRGANMRIALSDDLLNRMIPKQEPIVSPVRDRIANTKVRGRARTTTQVKLRLMPDEDAWHFGLEATGKVYSDTKSDTWPARVRNAAKLQYQGHKEITINEQGLHTTPAQAQAQGRNELVGVDSQLDPIPIVGFLLRDMARKKHSRSRPIALNQAKSKVVRQVKQRMDKTTDEKIEMLEAQFRSKVLAPIEKLALLAEPMDLHTTADRAVMQLRLANLDQLAAHTTRPLAPSDSVLSVQMHESALNNAVMGMKLNGRKLTMLELFDYFAERFGNADAQPPEDMPQRATIQFASRDAVRVRCEDDQVELILSVAELAHRRDKIRNFQIHVHFRPVLNGIDVRLVREGLLQFSGRRLRTGPRVVLHSVIGKLLEKDQEIRLLNPKMLEDPRLEGLMVTQMVIEEGWIGLALGPAHPRRTAWRAPMPTVLETPFVR